jgi:hypothetical protein
MSLRLCHPIRTSRRLVVIPVALVAGALLAACGGDRAADPSSVAAIDPTSPPETTPEEAAGFHAPVDGLLSEAQITAYLRTSLLQFDLLREESGRIARAVERMESREGSGRGLARIQNMLAATNTLVQAAELVGGSFVRSARTLGYNPAEMDWVREQLAEISATLMMASMQDGAARAAEELREQVRTVREQQPGGPPPDGTAEYLQQLLVTADEIEAASHHGNASAPTAGVQALRLARPAVTDEMWLAIGFAGGASGLMALTGWSDPENSGLQARLGEWRRLFEDALENRASPAPTAR